MFNDSWKDVCSKWNFDKFNDLVNEKNRENPETKQAL